MYSYKGLKLFPNGILNEKPIFNLLFNIIYSDERETHPHGEGANIRLQQ